MGPIKWLSANWERVLFAAVGLVLMGACGRMIYLDRVPEAAAIFGLAVFSFIYANLARFKRFKGLGFEAELWEDKQREAASLIERLREVVAIYTREVVLGKVMAGRLLARYDWEERWKLYDDLVAQHDALGQGIDFSDLKREMDDYFLSDMIWPAVDKVRLSIEEGKRRAMEKISAEFGSPIRDLTGHRKRLAQYREIPSTRDDSFRLSEQGDRADRALKVWQEAHRRLKEQFDVDISLEPDLKERLATVSKLYQSRPLKVTPELIALANGSD